MAALGGITGLLAITEKPIGAGAIVWCIGDDVVFFVATVFGATDIVVDGGCGVGSARQCNVVGLHPFFRLGGR